MPTGYTAAVQDGKITDFAEFALQCARAFGALIMLRDDPQDAPIPEKFEPSPFYAERLKEAEERLRALPLLTYAECVTRAEAHFAEKVLSLAERKAQRQITRQRYEAMLAKARDWTAPTAEHVELKDFMIKQLLESIEFDCSGGKYDEEPRKLTGEEWRTKRLRDAEHDVGYYRKNCEDETRRAAERTEWLRALRASLGAAAANLSAKPE